MVRPRNPHDDYTSRLAQRRLAAHIEQTANFGLAVGWVATLVGAFCWFCVISRFDWLWCGLLILGIVLLGLAVVVPESLATPCRWWMKLAHWQGTIVMSILLTMVYYLLIAPAAWMRCRLRGTHPFHSWDSQPPTMNSGWESLSLSSARTGSSSSFGMQHRKVARRRSLARLLLATIGFFYQRGHYLILPILILLLLIGLLLFFVQGSVLAPFIYTLF